MQRHRLRATESLFLKGLSAAAPQDSSGLSLSELLRWVNEVAARFRPGDIGEDSRASGEFSLRSFRHYQTLGCIDSPERAGKQVRYRFRHYVQALLLRKLLWERVPSERIAALMVGRSTAETKQLLFEGIEIVARQGGAEEVESWKRIRVCDTLELEVRYMRRAFGPLWSLLLKRAGLSDIGRRKDMTHLVESMLALGL